MEQLMRWPVLRWERMFELHMARKGAEQLKHERDLMLAAVASNPVWDESDKNRELRRERFEGIHQDYKAGVEYLYSLIDGKEIERPPDPMETDPLFRPLRNRALDLGHQVSRPVAPEEGMGASLIGAAGGS